jgi:maltooligosyltrehalose trehalohydrolase
MSEFRVWAPAARTVEVECAGAQIAAALESGGWWRAEVSGAPHGADYAFIVDGGRPLPDPRSRWQPRGVHAPSRIVDHAAFKWTDDRWNAPPLGSAIIYEAHVGTFTAEGTFDAAIARLDYLAALGVTHLELMPVAAFAGDRGWGYDGVDLFAPHHAYGGPDGLKQLVDACHARGLAVLLDVVYNHFGPSGNYLSQFGPYLTDRYKTPWGDAVNLDGRGSDEVRRYFCDNALAWLRDYHLDGLRIDAVHAIVDTSAVHLLEQMAREVGELSLELGRRLVLIAESDLNDPRLVRPAEIGGYGLDAMWCDDFHHAVHTVLTGERSGYYADFGCLADLAKALTAGFVYDGRYSEYRGRSHGRPPIGVPAKSFVAFVQNHDQVGNRAAGERLSHLASAGRAKIAAAILMIAPMVPIIFRSRILPGTKSPSLRAP